MNEELIQLARIKCMIGYGVCLACMPFILWPWGKNRPVHPKRVLIKKLRRQQPSFREIPPELFERPIAAFENQDHPLESNILAFSLGQTVPQRDLLEFEHLVRICKKRLEKKGYGISHEKTSSELASFSARRSGFFGRTLYDVTIEKGVRPNCFIIHLDLISHQGR